MCQLVGVMLSRTLVPLETKESTEKHMKTIQKSKLAKLTGGTTTTILLQVGYASDPQTYTENEYVDEESIGKVEPIIVEVPSNPKPLQ